MVTETTARTDMDLDIDDCGNKTTYPGLAVDPHIRCVIAILMYVAYWFCPASILMVIWVSESWTILIMLK